jgi:hypothetical protein
MLLLFPSIETLHLALSKNVIPTAIGLRPAIVHEDGQGTVLLRPETPLPDASVKKLERLGVSLPRRSSQPLTRTVSCWQELVPLERERSQPGAAEPALFEVAERELPRLIADLQRLGCLAQQFCWTEDSRALVRVPQPPAYALLRATDSGPNGMIAYLEGKPRVWIEVGWLHPLLDQIEPPPGQAFLIRRTGNWSALAGQSFDHATDNGPFAVDTAVPWGRDASWPGRIVVPLRLRRLDHQAQADLWVTKEAAVDQLRELLEHADERLVARLSFAVGRHGPDEVVVLRVQPSRHAPPALQLDAVAFRSYLRLSNLFLPCRSRLQPPLRRDAVRQTFTVDAEHITWLFPRGTAGFTWETLPEKAFQPLDQWVTYVIGAEPIVLSAWQPSAPFDFQRFEVEQSQPPPPPAPVKRKRADQPVAPAVPEAPDASAEPRHYESEEIETVAAVVEPEERQTDAPPPTIEWLKRLGELQQAFLDLKAPLDDPQRQQLWAAMAQTHAALQQTGDAALCWSHAVWETHALLPELAARPSLSASELDRLLGQPPSSVELHVLIVRLFRAAQDAARPAWLQSRLQALASLLERNEEHLPVRLAWLAHLALYRLAGRDVLALTKARDRVLERLYQHGLRLELDLPGFLRFSGKVSGERLVMVRSNLTKVRDVALAWLRKHSRAPLTAAYADLTFAFGLARLGDGAASQRLLEAAGKQLRAEDEPYVWLYDAYAHRIGQALRGERAAQPLPAEVRQRLDTLTNDQRYKGDRLRKHSRILEPQEKVDPVHRWHEHYTDVVERELASLQAVDDRAELRRRLTALLEGKQKGVQRGSILARALELAPRLGEEFARGLLERVTITLSELSGNLDTQALLLEQGIRLAAHYDQAPLILTFVDHLMDILAAVPAGPAMHAIEPLLEQMFHGLRKFGMRVLIGKLLERLTDLILGGRSVRQVRAALAKQAGAGLLKEKLAPWKALVHLAGGWLYFGDEGKGWPILDETRALLFQGALDAQDQANLAVAYVRCLAQAEVQVAVARCLELLRKIRIETRNVFTDSHFSLAQLVLLEAVVLTLASDDFALDPQARHWLEDDEYHVRRRIHGDVRRALQEAGL